MSTTRVVAAVAVSASACAIVVWLRRRKIGLSTARLQRVVDYVRKQVDGGFTPMMQLGICHRGKLVLQMSTGFADAEQKRVIRDDTITRVYSMTKPIVSTMAMMLVERAMIQLDHPVSNYLPCFAEMHMLGPSGELKLARTPITLQHLLTHTSGLSYPFFPSKVATIYKEAGIEFGDCASDQEPGALRREVEKLAKLPLLCEPGTEFHYSYSLDVIGCVLEIVTGQTLGELLRAEILEPLQMSDTAFFVPREKAGRFAACYELLPGGGYQRTSIPATDPYLVPNVHKCKGGGGLVSTLPDMLRFVSMLAGKGRCPPTAPGGASVRLLSRTSVEFMMCDHLAPGVSVPPGFLHAWHAVGFGIGGSVVKNPARNAVVGGGFSWGHMANGYLYIDPKEELAFVMLSQITPSFTLCRWRRELQSLIQACIDD